MDKKYPKVGIGVMIMRDNKILLGLRKGSHGEGEWSFPGGHLEWGETVFQTAIRETMEEVGLDVNNLKLISVADEVRYIDSDDKHYLNVAVLAESDSGEPKLMEPDKCERWEWFDLNELPDKIFEGSQLTINNYKNKTIYFENKYRS
jgi:8-oxo-dGTP diphosphatase